MPELQLLFDYENIKPTLFSKCQIDQNVIIINSSLKTSPNSSVRTKKKTSVVSDSNSHKIGLMFALLNSSDVLSMSK